MKLLTVTPLGRNRDKSRLWIETRRLEALGFPPGTPFTVEARSEELILRPSILAENHVSSRRTATGLRPIIDVANQAYLGPLGEFPELKVTGWHQRLSVTPTRRAAAILRSRHLTPPFRVLEIFAGGGTLTAAVAGDDAYTVSAGIEIDPRFADIWQAAHPEAALIQADIRAVETSDLPEFDVLIGGIPCTSHSTLGRAKKSLAGKPELGDTGDLFLPVIGIVRQRMPAAILFENVPSFGTSLAGQLLTTHLERLGYHVFTTVLKPNEEWNEIEDRKRWILVATLDRPFELQVPGIPNTIPVSAFLDPPDPERDAADARRIERTIAGLRAHNARHAALGNGFGFTVLDGAETRLPVIPRSYHKINTGPFVQTRHGLRMLRLPELERIRGNEARTTDYTTGAELLGQGVLTGPFRQILAQLRL
ncbi:MAG: DNA cytosine methyltransferase [Verrucomicrobia bacterium]|jgi:DNA (cytosine-5)-methyltransferase 1|nr:DNA cytosine methyltransferase [Verrucomicrobiota bacterium]